jgi:17beta-estradiol 17-dehydrogenase / very-long-chain 3-oxoacyl-CoA reductase
VFPPPSLQRADTDPLFAVVTGATAGIGRDFALQLAGAGFNVFLASRTTSKLEEIAQEISVFSPSSPQSND